MKKLYRQGDVLIQQVKALPAKAEAVKAKDGRVILAYGEVTGHHHSLAAATVEEFRVPAELNDVDRYLVVDELSQLVHQEHATIEIQKGVYKIIQQREYSPEAIRNVQD